MVVGAPVAHHADRPDREQHRKGLPDLVVQPRRPDLIDVDRIHPTQQLETLGRYCAEDADSQPRAGERMAAHDLLRQPELAPDLPDFVLEEVPQRLPQHPGQVRA